MFLRCDRQVPGVLDPDPVDGVPAPVGPVIGLPSVGAACAFRTVGAGRDGDEMLRILEVVGLAFTLCCGPVPGTADVGVA